MGWWNSKTKDSDSKDEKGLVPTTPNSPIPSSAHDATDTTSHTPSVDKLDHLMEDIAEGQ